MLNRNYMVAMPNGKIHSMDINAEITVLALKHLIEDIFFIPVKFQNLLVGDRYLVEDDAILDDVMLNEFYIQMLYNIHGGCRYKKSTSMFRWKWKKKRTKRLQRKRRKMRMRAR